MERIDPQFALSALRRQTRSTANGSPSNTEAGAHSVLTEPSIVILFQTFGRRWAHRWEKINSDPKARSLWLHDLRLLGVTDDNLRVGLTRSASLGWPPSPAEFAAMCLPRPEDAGLPSEADAYREAVFLASDKAAGRKINPSHPAVWHSAWHTGLGLLRDNEDLGRKEFSRVWSLTVQLVLAGKPLEPIPKALPKPKPAVMPEHERQAVLAAVDEKLAKVLGRRTA